MDGYRWGEYLDRFLRECLDASSVTVLDASSYQEAGTIHDMNLPVPEEWHAQYDAIIDGGSLEHIFNVPVAFKNLADMLKVGGRIFLNSPANNLMGHGFYQFSPELMFRIFSDANGFEVNNVWLYEASYPSVELSKNKIIYDVRDPGQVHQRVGLLNKKPVMMMVEAHKTSDAEVFKTAPNQSDYVQVWSADRDGAEPVGWRRRAKQGVQALPLAVSAPLRGLREKRRFSFSNRRFYEKDRW